jgi:hypothetical protein
MLAVSDARNSSNVQALDRTKARAPSTPRAGRVERPGRTGCVWPSAAGWLDARDAAAVGSSAEVRANESVRCRDVSRRACVWTRRHCPCARRGAGPGDARADLWAARIRAGRARRAGKLLRRRLPLSNERRRDDLLREPEPTRTPAGAGQRDSRDPRHGVPPGSARGVRGRARRATGAGATAGRNVGSSVSPIRPSASHRVLYQPDLISPARRLP